MYEPGFSLDEEVLSPDIFSDVENSINTPSSVNLEEATPTEPNEPEPTDDTPEWRGISMDEIHKGVGPFSSQQHPLIRPSADHAVLFSLPLINRGPPKSYPTQSKDKWSQGYVRMPHSTHSLYPVNHENGSNGFRQRWEVIQEALLQSFVSSFQLEAAILSYNNKYAERWNFSALHHFFTEILDEEETEQFFKTLLPKIVHLALQLPVLVTGAIPLLRHHRNASISLSQMQVACLLANAFFCTFPRRNSTNPQSEYAMYSDINFNKLFSAYNEERYNRSESVAEKLKCMFHYFRRVTSKAPEGVITIQRRYIPREDCPRWDHQNHKLPLLHITSSGTIESEGAGLLQVDFANKFIGGGVLGWGCVQEEIRFVICPELMITMLVTEALDDTEALIVSGVERYSNYKGYGDDFKWTGDFVDETPRDTSGRRKTSIVAIDALLFKHAHSQFKRSNIIRELNKAYVGFSCDDMHPDNLSAIATGNWGCGAFRGNPQLKILLQLMAAAVAGRSMVYFTFGDKNLRDKAAEVYSHLVRQNVDVGRLYALISQYRESASDDPSDFYPFLYKRSKMKPITRYLQRVDDVRRSEEKSKSNDAEGASQLQQTIDKLKSFTSQAKQKDDMEELTIENWLDDIEEGSFANESAVFRGNASERSANVGKDFVASAKSTERTDVSAKIRTDPDSYSILKHYNKSDRPESKDRPEAKPKIDSSCDAPREMVVNVFAKKRPADLDALVPKVDAEIEEKMNTENSEIPKKEVVRESINNEATRKDLNGNKSGTSNMSKSNKLTKQRKISDFFIRRS